MNFNEILTIDAQNNLGLINHDFSNNSTIKYAETSFPKDLLEKMFDELSCNGQDFCNLSLVCKRFHKISEQSPIPKFHLAKIFYHIEKILKQKDKLRGSTKELDVDYQLEIKKLNKLLLNFSNLSISENETLTSKDLENFTTITQRYNDHDEIWTEFLKNAPQLQPNNLTWIKKLMYHMIAKVNELEDHAKSDDIKKIAKNINTIVGLLDKRPSTWNSQLLNNICWDDSLNIKSELSDVSTATECYAYFYARINSENIFDRIKTIKDLHNLHEPALLFLIKIASRLTGSWGQSLPVLEYLFESLPEKRKDKSFIIKACQQNNTVIQHVSDQLKNDKDVIAAAGNQS